MRARDKSESAVSFSDDGWHIGTPSAKSETNRRNPDLVDGIRIYVFWVARAASALSLS
jgi:hypothetical protein